MKWDVAELPGGVQPDVVSVGLREEYAVDDDGTFETPDDVGAAVERRLEEAGHTPVEGASSDDEPPASTDEDVDEAVEELEEDDDADEPDDEYADMDRSELYEEYKDRGGPKSWNDTTEGSLRTALRTHDESDAFPGEDDS